MFLFNNHSMEFLHPVVEHEFFERYNDRDVLI